MSRDGSSLWLTIALSVVFAGACTDNTSDGPGAGDAQLGGGAQCSTADDCAAGLGCRAAEGSCDTCRVAAECRAGEACDNGECGPCTDAVQCDGLLCNSDACEACTPGVDDAACAAAYSDDEFRCNSDGTCGPHTCTSTTECQIARLICSPEGRCVACGDAFECLDAGYPTGTLCVDGECKGADCLDDEDCLTEKPICGGDSKCRGCQTGLECTLALEAEAVCETNSGLCFAGDCAQNDAPCGTTLADQICIDHVCSPCTSTPHCQSIFGTGFLCIDGHCQGGNCTTDTECDGGQRICGTDHYCRSCILNSGECGADRVCGSDGRCHDGDCYPPSTGCCDAAGEFRPDTFRCSDVYVDTEYRCAGTDCGDDAEYRRSYKYCSGTSAVCDESNVQWETSWHTNEVCLTEELCSATAIASWCDTCEHGCSAGACYPDCNPDDPCCSTTGTFYDCWYDSTTGIEWQDPPVAGTWQYHDTVGGVDAKEYCQTLTLGGYSDWNVPSPSELRSLIRGCDLTVTGGTCRVTDGCLDNVCYDGEECNVDNPECYPMSGPGILGCYWPAGLSRDNCGRTWSCAGPGTENWTVSFGTGAISSYYIVFEAYVRCLRGGICPQE